MKRVDEFKATNRQLADALAPYDSRPAEDKELVRVSANRSRLTVRAGTAGEVKKKLEALRLRRTPITSQASACRRSFPKFERGMSVREYVQRYSITAGRDAKVLWGPREYGLLNGAPATLYEGGATDFDPVVEIEAEETEAVDVLDLV